MGLGIVGNLIAHAWGEYEAAPVLQFRVQFAFQAKQDMAFAAPMIGKVARAVLHDPHTNIPKLSTAPGCRTHFTGMLAGLYRLPIRDAEGMSFSCIGFELQLVCYQGGVAGRHRRGTPREAHHPHFVMRSGSGRLSKRNGRSDIGAAELDLGLALPSTHAHLEQIA